MRKFYIIALHREASIQLERVIKDIAYNWMHYLEFSWIIVSDMSVQGLIDKLAPYCSTANGQRIIVTEINPSDINGWLPHSAWIWFKNTRLEVEYMNMESPTLSDAWRCGILGKEIEHAHSIADIDELLKPYEATSSSFELDLIRQRVIDEWLKIAKKRYEDLMRDEN